MNYLIELLNPAMAGYIYGTSLKVSQKNFINNIKETPFTTSIHTFMTASLYGLTGIFASKYVLKGKENTVFSGFLLGVSIYNIYGAIKQNKKKYYKEINHDEKPYNTEYPKLEHSESEHSESEHTESENDTSNMEDVD